MSSGVNAFINIPVPILQNMQAQWIQCLTAISLNQSYSMAGRTYTRANLEAVKETLGEIAYALQFLTGNLGNIRYADMSNGTAFK